MEINIVSYRGDKELERIYGVESPEDITCKDLLLEFKKLMVQIGFAAELVNKDWEYVEDV